MIDKDDVDWCCGELRQLSVVYDGRRTWSWRLHIAEVGRDRTPKLVASGSEPNMTTSSVIERDFFGDEYDFTFRYCPFCGTETDGLL